jgi:hypothetical protein
VKRYAAAISASVLLHVWLVLTLLGRPGTEAPAVRPPEDRALTTFPVTPPENQQFPGLNSTAGAGPVGAIGPGAALAIGDFRIDLERIARHADVLFPFIRPGLSLDRFFPQLPQSSILRLENPAGRRAAHRRETPPLVMTDAALQATVDRAWSRRDRWEAFAAVRKLAETHDPDAGRLPVLLKAYRDQNALQPYADRETRDPRLWAQLGLAADHVDFIAFVRGYAAAHPSTKASTELLLLLEAIAQASNDALNVLLETDPADQLFRTARASPAAYALAERIHRGYRQHLARMGLIGSAAITLHYDAIRLKILERIAQTTPMGYRLAEAHFRIGAIYWRQQRTEEALRWWLQMNPDADSGEAPPRVIAALRTGRIARPVDRHALPLQVRAELDRILKSEEARWWNLSSERLRAFGYRFDSY